MNKRNAVAILIAIMCFLIVGLGCVGMRRPWRSYDFAAFDAEGWTNGDAITRGTMARDLVGVQPIREKVGENMTDIIKKLGEPTLRRNDSIGERKITALVYEVDLGEPAFMDALQVYIDEDDMVIFANLGVTVEKEGLFERFGKWQLSWLR